MRATGRLPAAAGALALAAMALWQARQAGVAGLAAVPDAARGLAAALLLYGLGGYALARRWLPEAMRPHWPLFVLPAGAMSTGLLMTLLGFAAVPFTLNLTLTLLTGIGGALWVHRRGRSPATPALLPRVVRRPRDRDPDSRAAQPPDARKRETGRRDRTRGREVWAAAYVAAIITAIALIPVFRSGFATVVGEGSDAHLATGTATFLKHAYPTATEPELPVDRVPLVWRSKYPVYYSLAGVSSLAGLDTVETIATLAALLAALAALGFFCLARHLLRAGPLGSLLAMALVGLNAMVLFTATHPYFNQTWGLVAMPFMILFAWWALREPRPGTVALALLFSAVGAFAYPLMLAFPAMAFCGFAFFEARRRRREGRPIDWRAPLRRLPRGARWLPAYALAAALLAVPLLGVFEKLASGFLVIAEGRSLAAWAGDILHYIPLHSFFSLVEPGGVAALLVAAVAVAAFAGLRGAPRPARRALLVMALAAAWFADYFHGARDGQYFYFKTLAYLGPAVVTFAAAGLGALATGRRPWLRGTAAALALAYLAAAALGARDQIGVTFDQVTPRHRQLIEWDRALPAGSSVRLDVEPTRQIWVAYFLHHHPLSSLEPLEDTSYPHVPQGRRAGFVIAEAPEGRPSDATGPPLRRNRDFALYRMRAAVPGPDRSSRRMVQEVTRVAIL